MEIIQFFIDLLSDPRGAIAGWINDLGPIWMYADCSYGASMARAGEEELRRH